MLRILFRLCLPALVIVSLAGCQEPREPVDPMIAVGTILEAPDDYAHERIGTDEWPMPPYAKYLNGVRICLDPGHGGDAHKRGYKRGPSGVREAEVNLRVANYLRDWLQAAGAEVRLTRESDVDSSLAERAEVANRWPTDLFISLHHNAIGKPDVNRTAVFKHKGVDYRPANLDLARYLCQGLMYAFQFPQLTGDSIKSDQLIYDVGFGVLRNADVTAALTESSFFSNPEEEQRLRTAEHNFREAYGLFDGLARYVYAGLPRQQLVKPADGRIIPGETTKLVFTLDDGLRGRKAWGSDRQGILTSSIEVRLDGEPLVWSFENKGYRLTAVLPDDLPCGGHRVEVQFVNKNKNSVLNPFGWIDVVGPVVDIETLRISPKVRVDSYLQRRLVDIDRALCAELGIAVEQRACGVVDLDRGRLAMIRPNAMFYAASVPKIAILLAYFHENPEAATDLDPAIEEQLGRMIKRSDNALAARFSEELGLMTIARVLEDRRYRLYNQKRGGGLWMGKHYSKDEERLREPLKNLSHAATVRQCLRFYLMLEQERLVSREASTQMKAIFASPSLDPIESKFVKGLAGSGATILRKSGTWEDHHLDTALIEHDGQRFILVGITEHPRGAAYLEQLAVEVDRMLLE